MVVKHHVGIMWFNDAKSFFISPLGYIYALKDTVIGLADMFV